jgi:hypothetical protein
VQIDECDNRPVALGVHGQVAAGRAGGAMLGKAKTAAGINSDFPAKHAVPSKGSLFDDGRGSFAGFKRT